MVMGVFGSRLEIRVFFAPVQFCGYKIGVTALHSRVEECCYFRVPVSGPCSQRFTLKPFFYMPNALAEQLLDQAEGCRQAGNHAGAAQLADRALEMEPQNLRALSYGAILIAANGGQKEMALHLIKKALKLGPDSPVAIANAAQVFLWYGQPHRAYQLWERLIKLKPRSVDTLWNLAVYHYNQQDLATAEKYFRKVMDLNPRKYGLHLNLGTVAKDSGRIEEAIDLLRGGMRLYPQDLRQSSSYLFALHFDPACSPERLQAEHAAWGQALEAAVPAAKGHSNDRSPDRRLRIGYVSPHLCRHVVGYNLQPLLRQHDQSQFEIYCYSDTRRPDEMTSTLREEVDVWRETASLSDAELAAQILQDRIDVLVDLVMHTEAGRLGMFVRKPAPIQVAWMAYPGSTGLTRMDYRFTDPVLDPPGATDHFYTEQSVRLESFWCFESPYNSPAVQSPPVLKNGYVTFGCLNSFGKVNDAVLDLWREILAAVPDSRMVLRPPEGKVTPRVLEKLGVAANRVIGLPNEARLKYLNLYHRIDLALDPFPYTGHTTTIECLWMGVPLVTLPGSTVVSRGSLSILTKVGLTELAAKDKADYVAKAVGLARDHDRLRELRAGIRGRLERSVLMDANRFARQAESAYRAIWHKWCETPPGTGI
jgi:predicted O-linked N-acetylglucosamine transferase (SPINDLY family)